MIDNILIIEDEGLNSDRLIRLINNILSKVTINVLESVVDSVEWLNSNAHPSVILSDVRLSDGLCFEIFEQVRVECPIIFTTAYDEYAIKAFKVNGVDYLLKPVEQDELKSAFEKVESLSLKQQSVPLDGLIQYLKSTEYKKRFLLPHKDGYKTVQVIDIVYFYLELKITKAKLQNGIEETIPNTLEELEKQLDPTLFFRANRQYLIHIDSVQYVHNYFNGKLKIVLKKNPEIEIIVSRDKATVLKKWLDS
jgi:DNA-binding LytR/AlgR family response regulator